MNLLLLPALIAAALAPGATAPGAAPAGTPDIRSIVPPQPYHVGAGGFWLVVAGIVVASALLGFYLMARRPKPPSGPVATPRQIAARRLEELAAQMDMLDARNFGAAVADVLREYIGAQYGLHPLRQTSEEFLASITGSRAFSMVEHSLLAEFLDGCDLLKFARADATGDGKRRLLRQAADFLEDSARPASPLDAAPSLTSGV